MEAMKYANESLAFLLMDDKELVKADRKLFVHNLGELLRQTRIGVISCELDDDDIVTVTYHGGGIRRINVTMDSYAAIIRDVAKRVD